MARDGYILPIAASLLLHIAVGGLFIWGLPAKQQKPPPQRPNFVRAQLVQLEEKPKVAPVAKPKPKPDVAQQQAEARRQREAAERRAAEQKAKADAEARKRAAEKTAAEKAAAEKAAAEKAAAKRAADKAAAERRAAEERQAADQKRLAEALAAEQAALEDAAHATAAQSYMAAISQRIERNWSRPPSARNGMECELRIQLVPTGRVINVDVVRSSGNSQFDRSAVQAVNKAEQFPEVQEMDPAVFERYYRQLNLIFRPQDLRQ